MSKLSVIHSTSTMDVLNGTPCAAAWAWLLLTHFNEQVNYSSTIETPPVNRYWPVTRRVNKLEGAPAQRFPGRVLGSLIC